MPRRGRSTGLNEEVSPCITPPTRWSCAFERIALLRLYHDIAIIVRDSIIAHGMDPDHVDDITVYATVAIGLGHAENKPFIKKKLGDFVRVKKTALQRRLSG